MPETFARQSRRRRVACLFHLSIHAFAEKKASRKAGNQRLPCSYTTGNIVALLLIQCILDLTFRASAFELLNTAQPSVPEPIGNYRKSLRNGLGMPRRIAIECLYQIHHRRRRGPDFFTNFLLPPTRSIRYNQRLFSPKWSTFPVFHEAMSLPGYCRRHPARPERLQVRLPDSRRASRLISPACGSRVESCSHRFRRVPATARASIDPAAVTRLVSLVLLACLAWLPAALAFAVEATINVDVLGASGKGCG